MKYLFFIILLSANFFCSAQITFTSTENERITYITVDESVESIDPVLAEFKGKVLLLDFWATWCRPCIAEFDDYDELYKLSELNEDFDILFISLDNGRNQAWQSMINREGLKGYHLNVTYSLHVFLHNEWGVKSIPRYMIIGRNGEIFEDNAPRPSLNSELIRKINRALKQQG